MINYYIKENDILKETASLVTDCWINVIAPTEREIQYLIKQFKVPQDFIIDSLDRDEIPRLEFQNEDYLIISRIPIKTNNKEKPYFTVPLGMIVIFKKYIITICSQNSDLIRETVKGRNPNFNPLKRKNSVLQLFNRNTLIFLRYLKQMRTLISVLEKELEDKMEKQLLISLFNYEKIFIEFHQSLKGNSLMLNKLKTSRKLNFQEEYQELMDDVLIDSAQALEMVDISSRILTEMMDFFSSLFSNSLNIIMKYLTGITIIIAIPTLIAGIYGMNIQLPFQDNPLAFMGIILFSLILSAVCLVIINKKRWF